MARPWERPKARGKARARARARASNGFQMSLLCTQINDPSCDVCTSARAQPKESRPL